MINKELKNIYFQNADKLGWGACAGLNEHYLSFLKEYAVGKSIIDIGCCGGQYVDYLQRQGFEATGIDFIEEFVGSAVRAGKKGNFICARAAHLPFQDKQFDTAVLFSLLEHAEDDAAVLRETQRVTRKRVITVVPLAEPREFLGYGMLFSTHIDQTHQRYYTPEALRHLFVTAGYEIIAYKEFAPVDTKGLFVSFLQNGYVKNLLRALLFLLRRSGLLRVKPYFSGALVVADIKDTT